MKDIKSLLNKIDVEEKTIKKIAIFLKTKRGQQFVSKLHTSTLKDLSRRYELPKFIRLYNNDTKNMNMILHVIRKEGITIKRYIPVYTEPPTTKKLPVNLTKKEIKQIDAHRPKKTLGVAAQLHMYEEAKMAKYIKRNPAPTERELKEDLFPMELKKAYEDKLELHRIYVRRFLVSAHYRLSIFGRFKIAEGKYERRFLMYIKDVDLGGHNINGIPKTHRLIQKVQHIADEYYKKDSNLICVVVKNFSNTLGRIIIPHKNTF